MTEIEALSRIIADRLLKFKSEKGDGLVLYEGHRALYAYRKKQLIRKIQNVIAKSFYKVS